MITGKKRKQKVYRVLNEHMSNTFSLSPNEQLYEKHQNNKSLQIARLLQVRSQSKQINLENRSKYHSSLSAVWSEALSDVKSKWEYEKASKLESQKAILASRQALIGQAHRDATDIRHNIPNIKNQVLNAEIKRQQNNTARIHEAALLTTAENIKRQSEMDAREKLRNDITTRERERASKLAEKHSKMLKSTINVIQEEYPPKNPLVKMNRIQLQKLSQHGGCDYDLSCFHRSAILKVDHHKKSALQDAIIASKIVETKLEKKKADSIKRDLKKNDRYINAVNVVIKEKVLVFNYKNHDGFIKTLKELRGNDVQRRQANTIMYTKGDFGVVKRSFVDKVFNERFVGESNNNIVGSLYRNENAEASIELIAEYSPKKN